MPSAFIPAARGYPALPSAGQPEHQRCVPPNPLVLGRKPLKPPAPTTDRDRPVSRRSKPSSRTAFIGEQPNPWELLHPQDAMSRHRTFFHCFQWRRLCLHPVTDCSNSDSPNLNPNLNPNHISCLNTSPQKKIRIKIRIKIRRSDR